MKYTKEQLQAMSDFEVNKALAKLITGYGLPASCCLDYCNNPSDIITLACQYELDAQFGVLEGIASNDLCAYYEFGADHDGLIFAADKNPLRAIACCLILVLQGDKE